MKFKYVLSDNREWRERAWLNFLSSFVAVGDAAVVAVTPQQGTEYEQGHNRRPYIWVGRMDEVPELSN